MTQKPIRQHVRLRFVLLGLLFVAILGFQIVHAAFSLFTLTEHTVYFLLHHSGIGPFAALSTRKLLVARLPSLVLFAAALLPVLWLANRFIPVRTPAVVLVCGFAAILVALTTEEWFSLHRMKAEKHAFLLLRNHLESAAAPGESLVVQGDLSLPMSWYGVQSSRYALQTECKIRQEEVLYLGVDPRPVIVGTTPWIVRQDDTLPPEVLETVARFYRLPPQGIYFVSPPAPEAPAAISSKP